MNWETKDGRSIPVSEMETEHIVNALAHLRLQGYVSPKTVAFYVYCPPPRGDMAQYFFDKEQEEVFNAPSTIFIDLFTEELKKRKHVLERGLHELHI